jgi:hypothetical protein
LGNRIAQGDYGIDQPQFRQSQIAGQRDTNAIVVARVAFASMTEARRGFFNAGWRGREFHRLLAAQMSCNFLS